MGTERSSTHKAAELITDPDEKARVEARNGLLQYDEVDRRIGAALAAGKPYILRPSAILALNRIAIQGIQEGAGTYRTGPMEISDSKHVPPDAAEVPELMEDMCDYVNSHLDVTPIHIAAYLMWRLNWIHPFADGNGRTSRAVSYMMLCIRLGYRLPGKNTIPDQITADKFPYYDALDAADLHAKEGRVDVTAMEKLLSERLAGQLVELHRNATGGFDYTVRAEDN